MQMGEAADRPVASDLVRAGVVPGVDTAAAMLAALDAELWTPAAA
jgi:hypothetical protein